MPAASAAASPPPPPLFELLASGQKERLLVDIVSGPVLLQEHHNAPPWSAANVYAYLDAQRPSDGFTAVHIAADLGFPRLARAVVQSGPATLLDRSDNLGRTPLMYAASMGQVDVLQELLSMGASLTAADRSGKCPLHHAIQLGPRASEVASHLLQAKADVNTPDQAGLTPLMYAVAMRAQPCVESLMEHGANPIGMDRERRTVLDIAQGSRQSGLKSSAHAQGTAGMCLDQEYPRWDHTGSDEAQQTVLLEERIARRRAAGFGKAESYRLRAAMPQLDVTTEVADTSD